MRRVNFVFLGFAISYISLGFFQWKSDNAFDPKLFAVLGIASICFSLAEFLKSFLDFFVIKSLILITIIVTIQILGVVFIIVLPFVDFKIEYEIVSNTCTLLSLGLMFLNIFIIDAINDSINGKEKFKQYYDIFMKRNDNIKKYILGIFTYIKGKFKRNKRK